MRTFINSYCLKVHMTNYIIILKLNAAALDVQLIYEKAHVNNVMGYGYIVVEILTINCGNTSR